MYLSEAGMPTLLAVTTAIWCYGRSGNGGNQVQVHARTTRRSRRGRDERLEDPPVRPPSLYVKQSPVPARRPLRRVPFTNLLWDDQAEQSSRGSNNRGPIQIKDKGASGEKAFDKNTAAAEQEEEEDEQDSRDRGTKWASLFKSAGSRNTLSSGSGTAWYDNLFAQKAGKKPNPASSSKGTPSFTNKLSSQQEKSIEQLQTLVKTLGVSSSNESSTPKQDAAISRSSSRPQAKSGTQAKSGRGTGIDPVSFSSILKKLQDVSSSSSGQEQAEDEEVYETEVESEDLQEEDGVEQGGFEPRDLSELKVGTLRQMAKAKGLAGYSKMKKDELVQLLARYSD